MKEDLNNIKAERDRLVNDISQLKDMHKDDEKEWKDTTNKKIKEKENTINNLEEVKKELSAENGKLQKINKKIQEEKKAVLREKEEVVKENKKVKDQIKELEAKKEELELRFKNQIDPKELSRLKAEKRELLAKITQLTETASNSLKECQKLKEERKNLNFRNRKYIGTMIIALSVVNLF